MRFAILPVAAALVAGCMAPPPQPVPAASSTATATATATATTTAPAAALPCDSNRTSETILMVQQAEAALLAAAAADPAFGGAWYEHAPCYRLVIAFTDGLPRPALLAAAPPPVRPYIAFGTAKLTASERERARIEITSALARAGVRITFFGVSTRPERFEVGVRSEAEAAIARQAMPQRYRSIAIVSVASPRFVPERDSIRD